MSIRDYGTRSDMRQACKGKRRHANRGKAEAHLRGLVRLEDVISPDCLHVYLCPICHHWHVGHDKQA